MLTERKMVWIKYYIPAYLYAGFIFALSSYSFVAPPSLPKFTDKIVHLVEYAIFGFLLARSYFNAKTNYLKQYSIIHTVFTGAFWGLLDEYYQTLVPLRHFESLDLLTDILGIFIGTVIYKSIVFFSDMPAQR